MNSSFFLASPDFATQGVSVDVVTVITGTDTGAVAAARRPRGRAEATGASRLMLLMMSPLHVIVLTRYAVGACACTLVDETSIVEALNGLDAGSEDSGAVDMYR